MHKQPAAYQSVYDRGDTVRFNSPELGDVWGEGPHQVIKDDGNAVTITVTRTFGVPRDQVELHTNQPAWMEPGYEKFG